MAKLPFDKLRLRMNIADMAQEFRALVMIPWLCFARFGLLEDCRTADVLEFPCCHPDRLLDLGQRPTPANFIDSPEHWRVHFPLTQRRAGQLLVSL